MIQQLDTQPLQSIVRAHPYPLLFATVGGSHAFHIASPLSDYDIHGVHLLSLQEVLGLGRPNETLERKTETKDGVEVDLATHDLRKFVFLLLKGNGNVLEDLYSPLVVVTSPIHEELKELGKGCITKQLAMHYKGMAYNQQRRMQANDIKKFLHMFRCLLMGKHLMRTGELVMDLPRLIDEYRYPSVHQLIDYKRQGYEYIPEDHPAVQYQYIEALTAALETARLSSSLPEHPSASIRKELEALVVRVRMEVQ